MLRKLAPATVIVKAAFEPDWNTSMLPEEFPLVKSAVPKRQREFAAARNCARNALAALGEKPLPILSGARREPLWPEGVVGSITHCDDYCAAAVAYRSQIASLGIDVERNLPLPIDVRNVVTTSREQSDLDYLQSAMGSDADPATLVFSAKESLFKAWYPLTKTWLGFEDATLKMDLDACSFSVQIDRNISNQASIEHITFNGRFAITDRYIFTFVTATDNHF